MSDKIKSLSKTQMINLLMSQEKEIEEMAAEIEHLLSELREAKKRGNDATSVSIPALVDDITKAAQEAANKYVQETQEAANKYMEDAQLSMDESRKEIINMELKAREYYEETIARSRKTIASMCGAFEWQIDKLKAMYSEFQTKLDAAGLSDAQGYGANVPEQEVPPYVPEQRGYYEQ